MMRRIGTVLLCASLAACAIPGEQALRKGEPGVVDARVPPATALAAIHRGQTKEEVQAALGPAGVVPFDSGWQVWVYRWPAKDDPSAHAATEVDVLIDPTGLVRKARLRPGIKSRS